VPKGVTFDPDDETMAMMYKLRRFHSSPWSRIAELVGSSPGRIKQLLQEYEKELEAEKAFQGTPPLMKDCWHCLPQPNPEEACSWPCPRYVAYACQLKWMPKDLRGKRT